MGIFFWVRGKMDITSTIFLTKHRHAALFFKKLPVESLLACGFLYVSEIKYRIKVYNIKINNAQYLIILLAYQKFISYNYIWLL